MLKWILFNQKIKLLWNKWKPRKKIHVHWNLTIFFCQSLELPMHMWKVLWYHNTKFIDKNQIHSKHEDTQRLPSKKIKPSTKTRNVGAVEYNVLCCICNPLSIRIFWDISPRHWTPLLYGYWISYSSFSFLFFSFLSLYDTFAVNGYLNPSFI